MTFQNLFILVNYNAHSPKMCPPVLTPSNCAEFASSTRKRDSYIFYKLSAVKEGAKIETINTVHSYLFLLSSSSILFKEALSKITAFNKNGNFMAGDVCTCETLAWSC